MKSLKEIVNESIVITTTLGPIISLLVGVGTLGMFNELRGAYDIMEIVRDWWKDSKASEIVRRLMNDSDIESLKSKPRHVQNKLLYNVLDSKLSQKDMEILANKSNNKIKAEI